VKVKNTGTRSSDEVAQVYIQHLGSAVDRPQKELKGFNRVHLAPGEERVVVFPLKARDLAYWDVASQTWRVEKEQIRVLAGGSSDRLPVQAILQIENTAEFKP